MTQVAEAIEHARLPEYVVDRRIMLDLDSTGEPAVWVWVIVADDTPPLDADQVAGMRESIRDALKRANVDLWAYVRVRSQSEQEALDYESRR